MPSEDSFRQAATRLKDHAERYNQFKENPDAFLAAVQDLDRHALESYREQASGSLTTRIEGDRQIRPVVFLRYVIVDQILSGTRVDLSDIEEIKRRIDHRDVDAFSDYPELHEEIAAQKERARSAFINWSTFRILHGIDYRLWASECIADLEEIAQFLQSELSLTNCDYHTASFDFNNNFGTDRCWVALYPEGAADHREAYQIFFGIYPDRFGHGIMGGDRVDEKLEGGESIASSPRLDVSTVLDDYEDLLPRFHAANRDLLREESADGPRSRSSHPLNLILYGPPGTGKTYSVQRRAVEIIEGLAQSLTDEEVSQRFREYLDTNRIEFTTFHPSYAYEEFVEGLRYDPEREIPLVQDGILKQLVERAVPSAASRKRSPDSQVWKISLGRRHEEQIFDRCLTNEEIAIGYLGDVDLTEADRGAIESLFAERGQDSETGSLASLNHFVNNLAEGDYVAVYNDPKSIRAIGVVDGDYKHKAAEYDDYPHVRPVEWIDQSVRSVYELNGSTHLNRKTVYPLNRVSPEELLDLVPLETEDLEPHVLIIDEINRGNLARVFGELITLLEPDKRMGQPNELSVRLPYSKEQLTLPPNLYVIGTMNTADRSIALLDAALRRRFAFEEMMPKEQVISDHLTAALDTDTIDGEGGSSFDLSAEQISLITEVFTTLNERVTALLDRDHQVGHSYFLGLTSMQDLRRVWYGEILPLLQEYFYDDHRRLISVVGRYDSDAKKGFIRTRTPPALLGDARFAENQLWDFHKYQTGSIETALRNTFVE